MPVTITHPGTQGPRGNSVLNGHGAPASSLGVDGDWYVDNTTPTSLVIYGPKAAGAWGSGVPFGGSGGALLAANNLSDVQSATTSRTNLGLGTAATQASSAFDASGAATTAEAAAIADAATKYLPLRPWLFDVTAAAYGAKGDGQFVTDGAMSSGSAVLTSATANFSSNDVGKAVMVKGAGAAGVTTLVTTIASRQSATQITLAASNASGSNVTAALAMWATDDTAHVQAAINAALTYAATHGSATVYLPVGAGRFYGIAGALQTGGSTLGNSQLTLGAPVATTANKICLTFEGVGNGSGLQHWQQLSPQLGGSTLVSFGVFASSGAQNTSITAAGNACVIGGPAQPGGYGISPGVFSNMLVTLKNLSILTTHSADGFTYSAADFSGIAEANVENVAYGTTGSVAAGDYNNPSIFGSGLAAGLLLPANGNNDNNHVVNLSCHGGYTYALFATEHTVIDRLCIVYSWAAIVLVGNYFGSVGSVHGVNIVQASIEACTNIVYVMGGGSSGVGPYLFATISTETGAPTFSGNSAGAMNAALGEVVLTGLFTVSGISVTYPTGLRIRNGQQGSVTTTVTSASSPYTVTVLDETIFVDATAGNVTLNLISAAWTPNRLTIIRLDASGNTVTAAAASGEHINGASTQTIVGQYSKLNLLPARISGSWNWYEK